MQQLPLWKIIARELCPKPRAICKKCIIQKRCIANAKRSELAIKEHYQVIPRNQTTPEDIVPSSETRISN